MIETILDCKMYDWTDGQNNLKIVFWGTIVFEDGEQTLTETIRRVALLFIQYKETAFEKISGIFSAIITDGAHYYLIKSVIGSPVDLYFTKTKETFIISNKLCFLLDKMEQVEPCEERISDEFLKYGFLTGSATLIRNVEKIPVGKCFVIDSNGELVADYSLEIPAGKRRTEQNAMEAYPKLIRNVIERQIGNEKKIAVTMSSGYDSNYLAWNMSMIAENTLDAFCIGGKKGRNEIENAKALADMYGNVSLHTRLVDSDTLKHYPEIIWRLEGSVYERGIFLQYELAKLVAKTGYSSIIEGDGADQVMHENFYFSERPAAVDIWHERPDIALRYIVLPKNMKMMNSFGIKTSYPYLDNQVISCLNDLKKCNGNSKKFHKQIVSECIGKELKNRICDSGGTTHLAALLENTSIFLTKRDEWKLPSYEELRERCGERETEQILDVYFKALYLELFYKVFIDDRRWWEEQYGKENESSFF